MTVYIIVLTVNFYLFGCAQLILTMHLQSADADAVAMSGAVQHSLVGKNHFGKSFV
jgi:hypothetical protein